MGLGKQPPSPNKYLLTAFAIGVDDNSSDGSVSKKPPNQRYWRWATWT